MALTRRQFLASAAAGTAILAGCRPSPSTTAGTGTYREFANSGNGHGGTILVLMPNTEQTHQVWAGLADELRGEFRLVGVYVENKTSAPLIARAIDRHQPAGLVLMNNPTVTAYREYQRRRASTRFPPAVIVMTSFLEGGSDRPHFSSGISYEVPLITVVTNLRKLLATRVERVGVIQRHALSAFVSRQASLAGLEGTTVMSEIVSREPNASEVKRALRRLKQQVDALWVLNDDRALTPRLIADGWLPGLNERPWVPTIVGAASLVSPHQSFGTFAVLPDHAPLGVQAANLVYEIAENSWVVPHDGETQLPLSTTTTIDLPQVLERFALREGALSQVDRILGS